MIKAIGVVILERDDDNFIATLVGKAEDGVSRLSATGKSISEALRNLSVAHEMIEYDDGATSAPSGR